MKKKYSVVLLLLLVLNVKVEAKKSIAGSTPDWLSKSKIVCSEKTNYIFFPEYNAYYNLKEGVYFFMYRDQWMMTEEEDDLSKRFNLKKARKVCLEDNTDAPHKSNPKHQVLYRKDKR